MTQQSDTFGQKRRQYRRWMLHEDTPKNEVESKEWVTCHRPDSNGTEMVSNQLRYTHVGGKCGGALMRSDVRKGGTRWLECAKCGKLFQLELM